MSTLQATSRVLGTVQPTRALGDPIFMVPVLKTGLMNILIGSFGRWGDEGSPELIIE